MYLLIAILLQLKITLISTVLLYSNICQSGIREDFTNYILCARRGLYEVPQLNHKNNVVYDELVLSDNKITKLNYDCFSRIKVKKIYLNGNPIESIDDNTFIRLENHLEELSLDSESINGIPKSITNYLRNLNTLKLKGFKVNILNESTFLRLNKIEILSLQSSSIEFIHENAFNGLENSLKELYLDSNKLTKIPSDALKKLKKLRLLSLSLNNIKSIDYNSFLNRNEFIPKLNKLDLSYNGLKTIDTDALNQFHNSLETLLLQNNEIYSFSFIKKLNNLNELNLDFNKISTLIQNLFENSQKLDSLSLQGNIISFTQDDIHVFNGLSGLTKLNLARNNIKSIPNGLFKSLNKMYNLILDKNSLENLDLLAFDGLQQTLVNISMQNTKLTSKDLRAFMILKRLERVRLGYNEIDTLNLSLFTSKALTHLDLQSNKINSIINYDHEQQVVLDNNSQIIELDLSNNKLCTIDETFLKSLVNLKYLGLSQNPLYCDCNLKYLYEWTMKTFDKDILSFLQWKCDGPENNMKKFINLKSSDFICSNDYLIKPKCHSSTTSKLTTTTTTTTSTSTISTTLGIITSTTTTKKPIQRVHHPRITDITFAVVDSLSVLVQWKLDDYDRNEILDLNGFKININELNLNLSQINTMNEFEIVLDKSMRKYKINGLRQGIKYAVCVSVLRSQGYDKYCRDVYIELDPMITSKYQKNELTNTSAKQSNINSFITFIFILMLLFVISLTLFLFIYVRKCRANNKEVISSKYLYNNTTTNEPKGICDCFQINGDTSTVTSSTLSSVNIENITNTNRQQICWQIPQTTSTASASPTSFNFLPHSNAADILCYDDISKQNILDTHVYCEIPTLDRGYTLHKINQQNVPSRNITSINESSSFRPLINSNFISNSVSII